MSGHAHVDPSNRKAAVLIAVFAACLALAETGAKSAQTRSISLNVEATNLWNFFQAKTIRQATLRIAGEGLEAAFAAGGDAPPAPVVARIAEWRATADRLESEPASNDGRREIVVRARAAEAARDRASAEYHHFEYSAAAFQLAIVLMSAMVVTGAGFLTFASVAMAAAGAAVAALGFWAPTLIHF
jgi:hypothetical protein